MKKFDDNYLSLNQLKELKILRRVCMNSYK